MEGRVVLVTGSAQGIGRDSALAFAAAGATVVVADVDEERGAVTVELVGQAGGQAAFVRCDVTAEDEVAAAVAFAVDTFGSLDCAHNNAGGAYRMPSRDLYEWPEADWDEVVDLNLKGVFLSLKHELRHMLGQGRGAIVNTASAAVYHPSYSATPGYVAAKAGVVGLTKRAAIEVAGSGIRVNAIAPGATRTDKLVELRGEEVAEQMGAGQPMRRTLSGAEIGQAAVWLCSDAASALTGALLAVDGGMSAL